MLRARPNCGYRNLALSTLALICCTAWTDRVSADSISLLNTADVYNDAYSPSVGESFVQLFPDALPFIQSGAAMQAHVNGATANATFDLSSSGFNISGISDTRTGELGSSAQSFLAIGFMVNQKLTYNFSGSISVSGYTYQSVYFADQANNPLFNEYQVVTSAEHSGTLNLGNTLNMGVDSSSHVSGSTTGQLTPGQIYHLTMYSGIYSDIADSGGSASGNLSLIFTSPDSVPVGTPLPSAAGGGLILVGALGLMSARRRYTRLV